MKGAGVVPAGETDVVAFWGTCDVDDYTEKTDFVSEGVEEGEFGALLHEAHDGCDFDG